MLLKIVTIATFLALEIPCSATGKSDPVQNLHPADDAGYGWFSVDMGISDQSLVVGGLNTFSSTSEHAVHVFTRTGQTWIPQSVLRYTEGIFDSSDFGYSVAMSEEGDELFVTNPDRDTSMVHVYSLIGGSWNETSVLEPSEPGEYYSRPVRVSGDVLAVIGTGEPRNLASSRRVYVFERAAGGGWDEVAQLQPPDLHLHPRFGDHLSVHGDLIVAGAAVTNFNGVVSQGAVYTWRRDAEGSWNFVGQLRAPDGSGKDFFASMAIGDGILAVGAYGRDVPTADGFSEDQGSVYLFEFDETSSSGWRLIRLVKSIDGAAGDWFGRSVALDGDTLLVGASRKLDGDGIERGAAYAFMRDAGGIADNWRQVHKFEYPGTAPAPWFGDEVMITPHSVVVGARKDAQVAWERGSAAVFARDFNQAAEPHPYDTWRHLHFPGQLMDRSLCMTIWGDAADPDQDGLGNLLEYLCGLDPNSPDGIPPITMRLDTTGVSYSIARIGSACANAYLQQSGDLRSWVRIDRDQRSTAEGRQVLELSSPTEDAFLRLAVEEE